MELYITRRLIIMASRLNTTKVLALVLSEETGDSEDVCDGSDEEFGMIDEQEVLGHEDDEVEDEHTRRDEAIEDEHTRRDETMNTENMEDDGETNLLDNNMNLDMMNENMDYIMNLDRINENMDYIDENFGEEDDINLNVMDEVMDNDDEEQYYEGDNEESDYDTDTDESDDENEKIVNGKTSKKNKSGLQ